jgi:uncharacterized protein
MAIILISGGTGLVGRELTKKLVSAGHTVRILSRYPKQEGVIKSFYWNVEKNEIDETAFDGVEHIVHLAGSGIADKRWSDTRKKDIIDSRVNSMNLIANTIKKKNITLTSFVGASAIGIYGMVTSPKIYVETDKGTADFLTHSCEVWEKSYEQLSTLSNKTCIIRIGVVLSKQGGALKRLLPLFKMGLGSAVGNGKQYMPWISNDDLVSVFNEALFNISYQGVYNAVATDDTTSQSFSKLLAKSLAKPFFMPKVPSFVLKLVFGEMANVLLEGSRVSNQKLIDVGFKFKYASLEVLFKKEVA